jgi:Flp pilus assembly protein TadG
MSLTITTLAAPVCSGNLCPTLRGRVRTGAAAVELAILLPFLGLMFAAAVDFARIYFATQTLENCAYSGALYASGTAWTSSSSGGVVPAAKNAACADGTTLSPALQPESVTVSLDSSTATVTVDYDFPLLTPVLNPSLSVHLKRTVTLNLAPVPGS